MWNIGAWVYCLNAVAAVAHLIKMYGFLGLSRNEVTSLVPYLRYFSPVVFALYFTTHLTSLWSAVKVRVILVNTLLTYYVKSLVLETERSSKEVHVHTEHNDLLIRQQSATPSTPTALGFLSLGLGLVGTLTPKVVGRLTGIGEENHKIIRAVGVREIASSGLLLLKPTSRLGVWSRVTGDVMDLILLRSLTLKEDVSSERKRKLRHTMAKVSAMLGFDTCTAFTSSAEDKEFFEKPLTVSASLAIMKSPQELYNYWRDLTNLPHILSYIESVTVIDERFSRWRAETVGAASVEWKAEIIKDIPGESLEWRTTDDADIAHSGRISLSKLPGDRGCTMSITISSGFGKALTKRASIKPLLARIASHKLRRDLRRFKQIMETGEIATTKGQPSGR